MRCFSLILLMLSLPVHGKSQVQPSTYLGEAKWVIAARQQKPEPLPVTVKNYPMTKRVTLDTGRKMFRQRVDPTTRLVHSGPTTPVRQTIRYTGKNLTAPVMMDAPPLQTRDNATFNVSYTDKQHGFAGTNTTAFAEDSNHHMWIASDNGLYRYDGYHYFLYGPKNGVPTMPNLIILYDNQQRLWLASDNGVYYIQHDSIFSLQTKEIDFATVPCFRVQQDHMNNIWLSTKKNGAICINESGIQVFDKRCGLPSEFVNTVHLAKDGTIYLGLRDSGMIVIEKDKMRCLFRNSKNMNTHSVTSFYEDEDGIWSGIYLGGLVCMGKKDTIQYSISGKYNERIFDIKKAPGGIWIAAYSLSLCYFNKTSLVTINETNGLLNRFPYTLFEDSFHNLWVSNLMSGFSRVNENNFYVQSYQNPAIAQVRRWMPDAKKGNWIITEGKNLLYQKGKETIAFTHKTKDNLEPFAYPLGGILDDDGTVWTGSYGPGIVHFNGTVNIAYVYTRFPTHCIVRFVEKDASGNIWFCPTDYGLIRYNNTSFVHYTQKSGLLSNTVVKLFVDGSKKPYWTCENGVQRLTNENVETLFIGDKIFPDQVNDLLTVDNQTTLLGSNENGLLIMKDNKVYHLTKLNGLSSNTIKTIIRDGSGKIWITTDKGIESFFLEGVNIREHEVYNQANGSFLTEVENAFLDSTGTPYWSLADKKIVFDPRFLAQQKKTPVFVFGRIFANEKQVIPRDAIKILRDQKISINYTAIFWGRENNITIKYLLISESGDTSFYSPGDKGHITISEIPPGHFRMFLSAKDNNRTYYSSPLSINVADFWYNTWLFRLSIALILVACIIYYFKQKTKRQTAINHLLESRVAEQTQIILEEKKELINSYQVIESQNQEKDVLIQEINHRVKNNLQFMIAMTNMELRKNYSEETLQALLSTSNRIKAMSLVHEMLYYKEDIQVLSAEQYINELMVSLKDMASNTDVPIGFTIDIINININSRTGTSLGMIISELVVNSLKYAFKHHKNPAITIRLSEEKGTGNLKLVVADNGPGIEGNYETKKGLGSRLVDIFSRQLKGIYSIDHTGQFVYTLIFKPPSL